MEGNSFSFFSIKTQFENIGDALINRELVTLVSQNSFCQVDLSRCPKEFIKTLDLPENVNRVDGFVRILFMMLRLRFSKKDVYYFLSPGGYVGELSLLSSFGKLLSTLVIFFLYLVGVRICHVGVSYESLGDRFMSFIKLRSKLLYRHVVRDNLSAKYATEHGISITGTMPDLALNVFDLNWKETDEEKDIVCFSFRTDQYKKQYDQVFDFCRTAIKSIPTNYKIVFYAQVERDVYNMTKAAQDLKLLTGRNIEFLKVIDDLNVAYKFFLKCRFSFSNRLHVLLMSGSQGCTFIACLTKGKGLKTVGIFESIGYLENIVSLSDDVTTERLNQFLGPDQQTLSLMRSKLSTSISELFEHEVSAYAQ